MDSDLKTALVIGSIFLFLWICWYFLFSSKTTTPKKQVKNISDDDFDF